MECFSYILYWWWILFSKNNFVGFIFDIIFVFKFETMAAKKYSIIEVALLATAFGKSTQTINRWIKANNDILTSKKAKSALLKLKK